MVTIGSALIHVATACSKRFQKTKQRGKKKKKEEEPNNLKTNKTLTTKPTTNKTKERSQKRPGCTSSLKKCKVLRSGRQVFRFSLKLFHCFLRPLDRHLGCSIGKMSWSTAKCRFVLSLVKMGLGGGPKMTHEKVETKGDARESGRPQVTHRKVEGRR